MGLCGPSAGETAAANAEAGFAQTMVQTFNTQLANQTATLGQINTNLQNLAAGNTPMGFSAADLSRLRGGAVTNTAQLFRNAMQRVSTTLAGQGGGGSSALTSGVQQQIFGDIAAQAAGKEAEQLTNIDLSNIQLGRENLLAATTGLEKMAELQSPEAYAGEAGSTLAKSFDAQHTMSMERAQALADIGGAITGGISAATGLAGGIGKAFSGVKSGMSAMANVGGGFGTPEAGSLMQEDVPMIQDVSFGGVPGTATGALPLDESAPAQFLGAA